MAKEDRFQTVIIGGGIAGVSCALELQDSRVSCVLLEREGQLGGQLAAIPHALKNFAGGCYENGEELRQRLVALVERQQLDIRLNHAVTEVDLAALRVVARRRQFHGQTILLATGCRRRKLHLPGEETFANDVIYDITGRVDEIAGAPAVVVGGGDSATLDALELAGVCPMVYLVYRASTLRARPDICWQLRKTGNVSVVLHAEVLALQGGRRLEKVVVHDSETRKDISLPAGKIVVKIGYAANTELFASQMPLDDKGQIEISRDCSTRLPGVFAAGDITTPGYPRLAAAMGQGMMAAAAIRRYVGNLKR